MKYVIHSHKTCRKLPEHFLRYNPINTPQISGKQSSFQEKCRFWNTYDKQYTILELRIAAFSTSTNLKNYFLTLTVGFVGVGHIL